MNVDKKISENWNTWKEETNEWIANKCGTSEATVRRALKRLNLVRNQKEIKETRTGIEVRNDSVVINWSTKTIITDLGEFGTYTCNFTTHGAIQRAYVESYEGKGQTAAEVATRFDFPHQKAVWLYAKIHNFTKASLGQSDIEFEMGLTPEEAANETLQSLKRRAMKLTERKKWLQIQNDADRWNNFELSILMPTKDWIYENLPKYNVPVIGVPTTKRRPFAAVIGLSDWHYMKMSYGWDGGVTYNREIALRVLNKANEDLIHKITDHGRPEKIYIPIGTDNLHIDNIQQTTTAGTPQSSQTEGDWKQELDTYVLVTLRMIDMYAQVAPVEVVCMPGNHDRYTSILLGVFTRIFYEKNKRVNVKLSTFPRLYYNYGKNIIGFSHGDEMSLNKFRGSLHKFMLGEARECGLNVNDADNYLFFTGHMHMDSFQDVGYVKHFIIPSLTTPDSWHRDNGYIGNRSESAVYIIDRESGRSAIYYS